MKKLVFAIVIAFIIAVGIICSIIKKDDSSDLQKIKVAEVAHSIFYAPQYVAHSLGYFKDEGLDVEINLASGADAVAAAVMSGDVQIGFCGSEQTIYIYNGGSKDYLINFAALTKKDGSFLVSRNKNDKFDISEVKGKHIIAGRKAGMPAMTLEWILNKNGIKTEEVNFDTSVAFAAMSGTFIGGTGDYVSLFEPQALQLEKQGYGYVVASLGELGGTVPYTTYNMKKSYFDANPKVAKGFSNAINKGLEYVHSHTASEIADVIADYFPDVSKNDLTKIVDRYMKIDSWYKTTYINEEDFNHIQEIMENAGELSKKAPYDKLVNTDYAPK